MTDLNARVGNDVIPGIRQRFIEDTQNNNVDVVVDLFSQNDLKISNTFFTHADKYEIT